MSYSMQVFWREDKKERDSNCFAGLKKCETVFAHFDIDPSLTNEEVDFYLEFVSQFLDEKFYTAKVVDLKSSPFIHRSYVRYNKDMSIPVGEILYCEVKYRAYRKTLIPLMILRYVQEYPEIVKGTFLSKGKPWNEVYSDFHLLHKDKVCKKVGGLNHTFKYGYYNKSTGKSLDEVKKLIADDDLERAADAHF